MKGIIISAAFVTGLMGAATAVAESAPAAELKQIQGSVLVNKGAAYRTAVEDMPLQIGDRVMLMDDASAVLVYDDGCVAEFKQNQILTVQEQSTCEGGNADAVEQSPLYVDALGGGVVGGGVAPASVAAGFGVGGLAFQTGLRSNNSNDDPISGE